MDLTLTYQDTLLVTVLCNGQSSHTFDFTTVTLPSHNELDFLTQHYISYGKILYHALFPEGTLARHTLETEPERLVLISMHEDIDALPWEYAYGQYGKQEADFLIKYCQTVRGLPVEQRIPPPLLDEEMHVVAIPAAPLDPQLPQLSIEEEWLRLKEAIQQVSYVCTLERVRPPTLQRLRSYVANQHHRIIHFMGHGLQQQTGAVLCFEHENGALDAVTTQRFLQRLRGTAFLVTLNACKSAAPGSTPFSNIAAALVKQKTPYALGMRDNIPDEVSRAFSLTLYNELAQGTPLEEAVRQARLTIAESDYPWTIGVPVLYTALDAAAQGFPDRVGIPRIRDEVPQLDIHALPEYEGDFLGRQQKLIQLGGWLTGDVRKRIITIHGMGGQGKTALARAFVERFIFAWTDGIWTYSLEKLPDRATFVSALARFLAISSQNVSDSTAIEHLVMTQLASRRILIVLDNAETLVDAVMMNDKNAIDLAQYLQQLPGKSVSLLVTAREPLGWSGEEVLELDGLSPRDGSTLFLQCLPQRRQEIAATFAWEMSTLLEGHPLGLRLLASAFDKSTRTPEAFTQDYSTSLLHTEQRYHHLDHRHRSLAACIEMSVQLLTPDLRSLLNKLQIFHAPFMPEIAIAILDPTTEETTEILSPLRNQLRALWQRSLLTHQVITLLEGNFVFYHFLPVTRLYVTSVIEPYAEYDTLIKLFGHVHAQLVASLSYEIDRKALAATIAQLSYPDLEKGLHLVEGIERGYYLLHLAWILYRQGNLLKGLSLLEQALEIAQGQRPSLELQVLNTIAQIYEQIGRPSDALLLYEQAIQVAKANKDAVEEAATLSNMASVYHALGQPRQALAFYEQALPLIHATENSANEGAIRTNMANIYRELGQTEDALVSYEQALPLLQETGNRTDEAVTYANMAALYYNTAEYKQALLFYQQAAHIMHEQGNRSGEATALTGEAITLVALGEQGQALTHYKQALLHMQNIENRQGEAAIRTNMASIYLSMGKTEEALALYEQALYLMREIKNKNGEASVLLNMAKVYDTYGQYQKALALDEEALPIMRAIYNQTGEATVVTHMAGIYQTIGEPGKARRLYQQALPLQRATGNKMGEVTILSHIGLLYDSEEEPRKALRKHKQALSLLRSTGNRSGEAVLLNNVAGAYYALGELPKALKLYQQALLISKQQDNRSGEMAVLINIAGLYDAMDRSQEALSYYDQALALSQTLQSRGGQASALYNKARCYQKIDQQSEALTCYTQAFPLLYETENIERAVTTLVEMAHLLATYYDRPADARRQLEQAIALLEEYHLAHDSIGNTIKTLEQRLQELPLEDKPL